MELLKFTRLSKVICLVLCVGYLVQLASPRTKDYLALVPGRTLPCVWNVFTGGFLIQTWYELLVECALLLVLAKTIEPYQGSLTFLIFVIVANVLACTASFLTVYVAYAMYREPKLLYMKLSGFHGVIAAMLVAYKQIMPDHELSLGGFLRVRARWVPSLTCLAAIMISVALQASHFLLFTLWGTYLGWLYLRFFQRQADSNVTGDPSAHFSFASFFPPLAQPVVEVVAAVCSRVFQLRHDVAETSHVLPVSTTPLLGTEAQDAQRRRERGAKALEERLSTQPAGEAATTVEIEPAMST